MRGILIGPEGKPIKALSKRYNVLISLPDKDCDKEEAAVIGLKQNAEKAVEAPVLHSMSISTAQNDPLS